MYVCLHDYYVGLCMHTVRMHACVHTVCMHVCILYVCITCMHCGWLLVSLRVTVYFAYLIYTPLITISE